MDVSQYSPNFNIEIQPQSIEIIYIINTCTSQMFHPQPPFKFIFPSFPKLSNQFSIYYFQTIIILYQFPFLMHPQIQLFCIPQPSSSLPSHPLTPFQSAISLLQELIVDDGFQNKQTGFMKGNCKLVEADSECVGQLKQKFWEYSGLIRGEVEKVRIGQWKMAKGKMDNFSLVEFIKEGEEKADQIDEQILEILLSTKDFTVFKQMLMDYKLAHEEEERYRILTVQNNKVPSANKVSSKTNSWEGKQKTEEELLIPEAVLTVRPLRKC